MEATRELITRLSTFALSHRSHPARKSTCAHTLNVSVTCLSVSVCLRVRVISSQVSGRFQCLLLSVAQSGDIVREVGTQLVERASFMSTGLVMMALCIAFRP